MVRDPLAGGKLTSLKAERDRAHSEFLAANARGDVAAARQWYAKIEEIDRQMGR